MPKGSRVGRVQKNTAVLNAIRKAAPENTRQYVIEVSTDMEIEYARLAPRDTSAMAEGVYVQLMDGVYKGGKLTSIASVEAIALALNPDAEISPSPVPTNSTTAYIKPIVKYYEYNEFGARGNPGTHVMAQARAHAQTNLKSKHMAAAVKVVTDGRR